MPDNFISEDEEMLARILYALQNIKHPYLHTDLLVRGPAWGNLKKNSAGRKERQKYLDMAEWMLGYGFSVPQHFFIYGLDANMPLPLPELLLNLMERTHKEAERLVSYKKKVDAL